MDVTAIFNFLLLAGALHGLIFIIVTFLARKSIEKPVLFLNLFVLFLSLNNFQSWLIDKGLVGPGFFLSQFKLPWYVLIVPMFYAFLVHYLRIEKKKWPFLGLSIAIFAIEVVCRSLVLYLAYRGPLDEGSIALYDSIEDAVTLSYSIFLYFKALRILYKYGDLYEPILAFDNLKWTKRFMNIGGGVILLWFVAVLLNLFSDVIKPPYSYYPLRLASSILIYWVGYQAFFQYVLLKDRLVLRTKIRKSGSDLVQAGMEKSEALRPNEQDDKAFLDVNEYVIENQRFLDPNFSLEKLAGELHLGASTLSRIINQQAEKNFPDYINTLRVEEAKKLLKDDEFSAYTIVAIGLECGFNSKSTFYSAFKKFTGLTPTSYRKEIH
ncbi:helix-turn-helix domain-containing protein [Poritiphilus flavus]|uniref:Helix-turn-helix domain-containing protein n=1 Tax=Poritiphilus flavus TaxID=2697053 RepID=A0A6L9EHE8_9FLAO|nr:helix-turn-helix domain-containing protein [Poritiphilus flavus]NAS13908.1 helix-turn-helix domain-containing protein [Poritiphilus flavus]